MVRVERLKWIMGTIVACLTWVFGSWWLMSRPADSTGLTAIATGVVFFGGLAITLGCLASATKSSTTPPNLSAAEEQVVKDKLRTGVFFFMSAGLGLMLFLYIGGLIFASDNFFVKLIFEVLWAVSVRLLFSAARRITSATIVFGGLELVAGAILAQLITAFAGIWLMFGLFHLIEHRPWL